ncbi:MAG: hypothetical protein JWN31_2061 [Frankiales bacterium]|nr:hypothetical protein [Frankiales bacterium]
MGTLTTQPYDVAEGQEWCDYFERLLGECQRLIGEKRMPATDGLDAFLHDSNLVMHQIRRDVVAARGRGEKTTATAVDLTNEEYRRLMSISESILNLLLILEMRGAVSLQRSEAVGRVAAAIDAGAFVL